VSWFSRKQKSMALSLVEAEYMAASQASCEALWLCKMLVGLFGVQLRPTVIIRVALNSQRIQFFMTGLSISRFVITSFVIMFREELWSYNTYLQRSRLQTYSPRHWAEASLYFSGISLDW
jgi:hypothetical protein